MVALLLRPFFFLLEEENEWWGYVNLSAKEVEGPYEGERNNTGRRRTFTLQEERERMSQGWLPFHSHPSSSFPEPSPQDILASHLRGGPSYVITTRGIWEIRPREVLSIEEVQQKNKEAWVEAQELAGADNCDEAFWNWVELIKKALPVDIKIIYKGGS